MNLSTVILIRISLFCFLIAGVTVKGYGQQILTPPERQHAERLARLFTEGNYSELTKSFSESLKENLSPQQLSSNLTTLRNRGGEIEYIQAARYNNTFQSPAMRSAIVPLEFTNSLVELVLSWRTDDPQGLLQQFVIRPASRETKKQTSSRTYSYVPPAYADSDAYTEKRDLLNAGGTQLPVTSFIPESDYDRNYPCVIFLTDRGHTFTEGPSATNKPYRDIAVGLATNRIAVFAPDLRYEQSTKEQVIPLLDAFLRRLALDPKVDKKRVYILGFGSGGLIATKVAEQFPRLSGVILVSTPAEYDISFYLAQQEREGLFQIPQGTEEYTEFMGNLGLYHGNYLAGSARLYDAPAGTWKELKQIDGKRILTSYKGKVLFVVGGHDYMLEESNYTSWGPLRKKPNISALSYPELGRWLLPVESADAQTELSLIAHVPEKVIRDLTRFISFAR